MSNPQARKIILCTLLLLLASAGVGAAREGEAGGDAPGLARASVVRRGEGGDTLKAPGGGEVLIKEGLAVGMWGGEHIGMEVTRNGAKVEYDCAHGTIGRRIVPDRRGRFDLPGTYTEESGGPVRRDARANVYAVRYAGQVRGGRMSLTVRRSGSGEVLGKFTLVRGQEPSIFKCR
jgi:hypothetical protein